MVIRQGIHAIRVMGRNTQGVKVINLKEGDSIADIAKVVPDDVEINNENGADNIIGGDELKDSNLLEE